MINKKIFNLKKFEKRLSSLAYSDSRGYFISFNSKVPLCSYICRENFAAYFYNYHNLLGFSGKYVNIKLLNNFFERIEKQLKLKGRTIFQPSDYANTVIITPHKFWTEDEVKQSLFTLLIRCGGVYYNGDFNKAITNYRLANSCRLAINWFLLGNTKHNIKEVLESGDFFGFVDSFGQSYNNRNHTYRKNLINPNVKYKQISEVWKTWK